MKILMVNVPFSGHINPTLPLARELVKRGHHVSYILTNQWKDRIEETGAAFIPYKADADYHILFKNPLIIIPLDMDQFAVADRVLEMKLGVKLAMKDVTADTLYELADWMMSDCKMVQNVEKMSNILQSAGNVKRAADMIEGLGEI